MIKRLPIVGVMGSGEKPWEDWAYPLGTAIAKLGVNLLTGGGSGVMTAVSKAFVETSPRKGHSIGVIPTLPQTDGTFIARPGYPNPFVEIAITTPLSTDKEVGANNINRNYVNILSSDAVIALPGSGGTRNEIDLAVKFGKPISLLGPHELPDGFHPHLTHHKNLEDAINWLANILKDRLAA